MTVRREPRSILGSGAIGRVPRHVAVRAVVSSGRSQATTSEVGSELASTIFRRQLTARVRFLEEFSKGVKESSFRLTSVGLGSVSAVARFVRPTADEDALGWCDQVAN
jgi:hypothetical protein